MSKFEPLKPSLSGDISHLVFKISKENTMFIIKILILPVYILT